MSNRANLANGITATAIGASSNTVALQPGYAASMPPVPFFATITPFGQLPTMGNSEIVQVTSASGNNLSVVRSQKGTVAKSFPAGSVFTNSVYTDDKITADNIDLTTMPIAGLIATKTNNAVNAKNPLNIQCGRARILVPIQQPQPVEAIVEVQFPEIFNGDIKPVVLCTFAGYTGSAADAWTDSPIADWSGATISAVGATNSSFKARIRRFDGATLLGAYYFNWIAIG